jgi:3-phenylpropionate/trans-cinnamate dioxygenase ferredoxin reductase subunit
MPRADLRRVVVVGAGVAGLTAVDTLRRRGFEGSLAVLGAEPHQPYDRPPLSKQVLSSGWEIDRITLRVSAELTAAGADWHLEESASGLDLDGRVVLTTKGRALPWDGLVIASGARPRRLPFGHEFPNVHLLRTIDDARALRSAFAVSRSVVVVGAGFLGCEVAAAARTAGLAVTLVDSLSAPMERHLGGILGRELGAVHAERGVRLAMDVGVVAIEGGRRAERVVLGDGTELDTDLVVVAIGCQPDVAWLEGSGLPIGDGVLCDSTLRVVPGVVAAGDVASWLNPAFGRRMRVEHRTNAAEQGAAAALTLLGGTDDFAPLPYFWSDQFDVRLHVHGDVGGGGRMEVVAGSMAERRFAALFHSADGPVASLTWNLPKQGPALRQRVLDACTARRRESVIRNAGRVADPALHS